MLWGAVFGVSRVGSVGLLAFLSAVLGLALGGLPVWGLALGAPHSPAPLVGLGCCLCPSHVGGDLVSPRYEIQAILGLSAFMLKLECSLGTSACLSCADFCSLVFDNVCLSQRLSLAFWSQALESGMFSCVKHTGLFSNVRAGTVHAQAWSSQPGLRRVDSRCGIDVLRLQLRSGVGCFSSQSSIPLREGVHPWWPPPWVYWFGQSPILLREGVHLLVASALVALGHSLLIWCLRSSAWCKTGFVVSSKYIYIYMCVCMCVY